MSAFARSETTYDLVYYYVSPSFACYITKNVRPADADAIVRIFVRTRQNDEDPVPLLVVLQRRKNDRVSVIGHWWINGNQIEHKTRKAGKSAHP